MGLDSVEFVLEIEEKYSISIADEDAEGLGIVEDIAKYIVTQSLAQNGAEVSYDSALSSVIDMLVNHYGVARETILPSSHVVKDLRLD